MRPASHAHNKSIQNIIYSANNKFPWKKMLSPKNPNFLDLHKANNSHMVTPIYINIFVFVEPRIFAQRKELARVCIIINVVRYIYRNRLSDKFTCFVIPIARNAAPNAHSNSVISQMTVFVLSITSPIEKACGI